MKYVLMPLFRCILFLAAVFIAYPLVYLFLFLDGLWDMKFKRLRHEWSTMIFTRQDTDDLKPGDSYWIYENAWHYIVDRKTWKIYKPEEKL